ncbi:M48 family metallopeptidase [Abyssibacter sp.]|jgi:predicted Zn-dependent protease|uniref:M48 family metallopeptidase n=1 Tax=Abyssibacter sp. TaxID=2320200 RepID=UPI000C572CCB|nr:peptidase [Xanthomonadales bacterium]
MQRLLILTLIATTTALVACATSPLGRSQLQLFPESQMAEMGVAAFQDMKQQQPLETSSQTNGYVSCVARAIIAELPEQRTWEVQVFKDDSANAFALPGGKIGVHTGLLDIAENQDQLATVIGHEVAHVLASHANERVSTSYVASTGLQLAQVAAGEPTAAKQQLFGLLGLGAQVGVLLPFSRTQESEADLLGLDLMAKAGFDPRASIPLWENMSQAGGGKPPEFLSTHPSHTTRIGDLSKRLQTAMPLYEQAKRAGKRPGCG